MENIKNLTPKQIALVVVFGVLVIASVLPYFVSPGFRKGAYIQVDTATYYTLVRNHDSLKYKYDSLQYVHSKVASDIKGEVTAQIRRKVMLDSVYNLIDRRLDTIYNDCVKSAMLVPYEEFALPIITIPYEDVQARCGYLNATKDPELQQAFQAFFDSKNLEHFNAALEKIRSKPSMFNVGLSDKELHYYDSLSLANQPYQPYVE